MEVGRIALLIEETKRQLFLHSGRTDPSTYVLLMSQAVNDLLKSEIQDYTPLSEDGKIVNFMEMDVKVLKDLLGNQLKIMRKEDIENEERQE